MGAERCAESTCTTSTYRFQGSWGTCLAWRYLFKVERWLQKLKIA